MHKMIIYSMQYGTRLYELCRRQLMNEVAGLLFLSLGRNFSIGPISANGRLGPIRIPNNRRQTARSFDHLSAFPRICAFLRHLIGGYLEAAAKKSI